MCVGVAHDGESGGAVAMSMLCVMHHMHVVCICVCLVAGEQESGGAECTGKGDGRSEYSCISVDGRVLTVWHVCSWR